MSDLIPRVRSFHRTVTQRIGTLSHRYLGRDRPLAESRLLFEIGTEGATVRELRARLGLDAGFVSRMLRSLEEEGLVTTVRLADEDGRVRFARLSRAGRTELRRLNELSDELVRSILEPLGPEQSKRLVAAMAEVERLLKVSAIEFVVEEPATREAAWCLKQYYRELRDRSRKAVDPEQGLSIDAEELVPPNGYFIVARLFGQPIGCGALKVSSRGLGEVKRMWVATHARGLGIGRKILAEIEQIARTHQLQQLRLETNETLLEAQGLYRTSGYKEVAAFNEEPAERWFEKQLGAVRSDEVTR